jgi:2-dehydro-3-deoxyphosphooctonate aldolase (KDO 8-P synthase)
MKQHGAPVIMDCTHSVQKPNQSSGVTGGDPAMIETIALSAVATGADGLFLEIHPAPHTAQSDPYTMLQMDRLEAILEKCMRVRAALNEEHRA